MIKTIRNWAVGILILGSCIIGLMGPLLWPSLYAQQIMHSAPYGIPLVQHHVELCDLRSLSAINRCEPFEPIRLA